MTYSITITDKKEAITIADGTITMTGSNPYSRVHVHGTPGVSHAKDGPVAFDMVDETVTISWAIIGKHGIYDNRTIVLKREGDAMHVTYRALPTLLEGSDPPLRGRALFTAVLTEEPVTYTLYRYRDVMRYRKELRPARQ